MFIALFIPNFLNISAQSISILPAHVQQALLLIYPPGVHLVKEHEHFDSNTNKHLPPAFTASCTSFLLLAEAMPFYASTVHKESAGAQHT
jgi:hypothetical protein